MSIFETLASLLLVCCFLSCSLALPGYVSRNGLLNARFKLERRDQCAWGCTKHIDKSLDRCETTCSADFPNDDKGFDICLNACAMNYINCASVCGVYGKVKK